MSKGYYDNFKYENRQKKNVNVNLYKHQLKIIDELVENDTYHNRSEFMRIAIEFYLSNEYIQALRKNEDKIIETIKNNNGKTNKKREKLYIE